MPPQAPFSAALGAYFELAKPRITLLLMIIAGASYLLASREAAGLPGLGITLLAVLLNSAGIFALNHYIEHPKDALMLRTRSRPIPSGRLPAPAALAFGIVCLLAGLAFCLLAANTLTTLIAALTALGYLGLYTPLKYRTSFHTALGALPGATPPLAGWAVAQGQLPAEAWAVYALMVLWQFPHFLAIETLYREDYARAEVKVVPVVDRSDFHLRWQVVGASALLIPALAACWALGLSHALGSSLAMAASLALLLAGIAMVRRPGPREAKRLLKASVLHLPLVIALLFLPW